VGERRDEARALTLPRPAARGSGRRADRLTEALKHYILTNRLPSGSRLPSERRLAEALMVSRNALRDEATGSVGYPMSVQLADGTIFTACELGEPVRGGQEGEDAPPRAVAGPEDLHPTASGVMPGVSRDIRAIDMDARPPSYITGSRYTEGYVSPLGR
jgi:hypothetical protein